MNAIIYTRVSTKEQVEEGNSLATQEKACIEHADRHNIAVKKVFREAGESAKTANRPELLKMLEYCSKNTQILDYVLLYCVDRLARDAEDFMSLERAITALGIEVIFIQHNFDNSPHGRFAKTIMAGAAQLDNEVRGERSRQGMIDAVEAGGYAWQAPLGYLNVKQNGIASLEHDPIASPFIEKAWKLLDSGYNITQALKHLTEEGLRNRQGKPVSKQTFSAMLRNPVYKGIVKSKLTEVPVEGIFPPLINTALWDRVYNRLEGAKVNPSRYRIVNPDFPLRGTLYCSEGHKMTASAPKGRAGKRYPKYHCYRCRGRSMNYSVSDTNKRFIEFADSFSYNPAYKKALREAIEINLKERSSHTRGELKCLRKRLLELDSLDEQITDKHLKSIYSDEHAQKMLEKHSKERSEIRIKLDQIERTTLLSDEVLKYSLEVLSSIGRTWSSLEDVTVRQRFQMWLFPEGLTFDGEKFGTTQMPSVLVQKEEILDKSKEWLPGLDSNQQPSG